ncbi:MAG TPA: Spy/CpxP family protein refolding chaperone [Vicinamibacterales bacterium]
MRRGALLTTGGALVLAGVLAWPAAGQPAPSEAGRQTHGWQDAGERRGPQRMRGMRGQRGMRGAHRRGVAGIPLRQLDLSDAQRQQVRSIIEARRADFRSVGERLRAAARAQHEAVTRVPVDENEVRARANELAAVQADMAVLRARVHEQVYQVLTPEQQTKLQSLRAEREKRRAERAERMKQRLEQRRQQRAPQQP